MRWSDTTGRRNETDQKWTAEIYGGCALIIHHYIGCGDAWFASCQAIGMDKEPLKATSSGDAKAEAIEAVLRHIDDKIATLTIIKKVVQR